MVAEPPNAPKCPELSLAGGLRSAQDGCNLRLHRIQPRSRIWVAGCWFKGRSSTESCRSRVFCPRNSNYSNSHFEILPPHCRTALPLARIKTSLRLGFTRKKIIEADLVGLAGECLDLASPWREGYACTTSRLRAIFGGAYTDRDWPVRVCVDLGAGKVCGGPSRSLSCGRRAS